jgi:hypothetical protein
LAWLADDGFGHAAPISLSIIKKKAAKKNGPTRELDKRGTYLGKVFGNISLSK